MPLLSPPGPPASATFNQNVLGEESALRNNKIATKDKTWLTCSFPWSSLLVFCHPCHTIF